MDEDLEPIRDAQRYANSAKEFADRGKDNAAISYLAYAMERLCVFLGQQELRKRGRM
jgi:hypothetical protein